MSLVLFVLLCSAGMMGQSGKADSLQLVLKNLPTSGSDLKNDSVRVITLLAIWKEYYLSAPDLAMKYAEEARHLSEKLNFKTGISDSYSLLAFQHAKNGNLAKALICYEKSLKIREAQGDQSRIASSLNNIAQVYYNQGNISTALNYWNKSLEIRESMKDAPKIASTLNNIAQVYYHQGDISKALEYINRSLNLQEKIGDKRGMGTSLSNIGAIHYNKNNIPMALAYYERSMKIKKEIGDKEGVANSLTNMAGIYLKEKNYPKALALALEGRRVSEELGYPAIIRNAALRLNEIYKVSGNYKNALENYELYIAMRDSINNESTRKASIKSQLKYEYEKQAAADSVAHAKESEIKNAEIAKQTAEIKAKKNQQYALFGGLGLVIIFAGFMYNRFKITQKQKGIIELQKKVVEEQKLLVEEKQKEILDSIHYAKRIQLAHIPDDKRVRAMIRKTKAG